MQVPVSERLIFLIEEREKGNKAAFGRTIGMSSQAVADLLGAKGGPSFTTLQKILTAYPDVSPSWLIFGEGPMVKGQQPEGAGLNSGEATVAESETLLKLAVTEAKLEASQAEIGRLYELLGKSPSSPDAAAGWHYPMIVPQGARVYARQR
jgi:hypothetical protein